jgi:hypothetical protein
MILICLPNNSNQPQLFTMIFDRDVFSVYFGTKTGDEMLSDRKNWIETDKPAYLLKQKFNVLTPWNISSAVSAAALGKDVVIGNFNPAF